MHWQRANNEEEGDRTQPSSRAGHSFSVIENDSGHFGVLFGGCSTSTNPEDGLTNEVFYLDMASDTWTRIKTADPPGKRWRHTASVINTDQLLIFGGATQTSRLGDCWVLNTSTRQWQPKTTNDYQLLPITTNGNR